MSSLEFIPQNRPDRHRLSDTVKNELKNVKKYLYFATAPSFHGEYLARYPDGTTYFRQCDCKDQNHGFGENVGYQVNVICYNEKEDALNAEKDKENLERLIEEVDALIDPKKDEALESKENKRDMKQLSKDVDRLGDSIRGPATKTKRKLTCESNKKHKA